MQALKEKGKHRQFNHNSTTLSLGYLMYVPSDLMKLAGFESGP
jgi:hypothetical protein